MIFFCREKSSEPLFVLFLNNVEMSDGSDRTAAAAASGLISVAAASRHLLLILLRWFERSACSGHFLLGQEVQEEEGEEG